MQEPPKDRVETRVVDMVDLRWFKLRVASLPADKVPEDKGADGEQAGETAPIDGRVAEKEVLDDFVVPAAHS